MSGISQKDTPLVFLNTKTGMALKLDCSMSVDQVWDPFWSHGSSGQILASGNSFVAHCVCEITEQEAY